MSNVIQLSDDTSKDERLSVIMNSTQVGLRCCQLSRRCFPCHLMSNVSQASGHSFLYLKVQEATVVCRNSANQSDHQKDQ